MTGIKIIDEVHYDGKILQFYRDQRFKLGIRDSVIATAKHFSMDSKDVCVALGLDPRRYA